ncbi:DEAD/DEAH box helicase family protein (plasmid) [Campylobacter fetus]|uniref:DEAD/DEAH box helicase family protein n=1 Tax=Campylobacter fetus TaxID=196 RepID=A0A974RN25_CAMFE|nr:SNF2-related protein [Campylobacter fetus]OCS32887.1 hypothetical protein AWR31_08075 [Campylobacter fetus subsp. venerealis]QMS59889.1 DEAD/DEAH box helicase family protein [Campylobacter fetus]
MARAKQKYTQLSFWDNMTYDGSTQDKPKKEKNNVSYTKSKIQRTNATEFRGDDRTGLELWERERNIDTQQSQSSTHNQTEIYRHDERLRDDALAGWARDTLFEGTLQPSKELGISSQFNEERENETEIDRRHTIRDMEAIQTRELSLGLYRSNDVRHGRAERESAGEYESLHQGSSRHRTTTADIHETTDTIRRSELDTQANDTLSLDFGDGELGDARRHTSEGLDGREEVKRTQGSDLDTGVFRKEHSVRTTSQRAERDGQHGYRDLSDNGAFDLQGVSKSERSELSDETNQGKTANGYVNEVSTTTNGSANSLFDLIDEPSNLTNNIQEYVITSTGENLNFTLQSDYQTVSISKKEKYKNNIEAIKLANELWEIRKRALEKNQNFTIARHEQEILSKFSGWGGISEVFDHRNEEWQNEYNELKELIKDKDEYADAKASTTTAFFTPKLIVDSMYKALEHMGINNNDNIKKLLEPSAGNGAFLASADTYLKENYKFDAVEIEPQSNKFLSLLYPNAQVYSHKYGFEDLSLTNKTQYDAIIGNPPYDRLNVTKIADSNDLDLSGYTIHNFFVAKSLRHLKNDGVMSFVITHNFLDAKNNTVREKIASENTFLGAVRLPNTAFSQEAKTQVVTDIVFFKKGLDKELNKNFINTSEFSQDIQINEYFKNNPQNVLGKLVVTSGRFGNELNCLPNPNINLQVALDNFIQNELPGNIYKYHETIPQADNEITISKFDTEYAKNKDYFENLQVGNYLVFRGELYQKRQSLLDDETILLKLNFSPKDERAAKDYIKLRDCRKELFELEKQDITDDDAKLINKRTELNTLYDDFVKNHNYLKSKNLEKALASDSDYDNIQGLEAKYNEKTKSAEKTDIFKQRVLRPRPKIEFNNAIDGLYASMNINGKIDIAYIANHLNKEGYDVARELLENKLIFLDPIAYENGNKEYIFAPKYLTGNVKEKLRLAEELAKEEPLFYNNVESLQQVIPADISPSDINPTIGVSWIPMKYYEQFFKEKFELQSDTKLDLVCSPTNAEWIFEKSSDDYLRYNIEKRYGYYHPQNSRINRSPYEIAQAALNGIYLKIYVTTDRPKLNPDGSVKHNKNGDVEYEKELDMIATQEVARKIDLIKNEFDEWIMKDYARRMDIAGIFNEKFNCYVKKHYDGNYLQVNGLNQAYNLRKHQKDAVARAINEKTTLIDHEVGAGKTLTAICSIMEQKKLGIVNKPLIVVPNHLVNQWSSEFLAAYPEAKLLVAKDKSMSKEKRAEFLAQIANNNYDAIIMKQTQFKEIPAPKESQKEVLNEMIAELGQAIAIREENSNGPKNTSVKRMQTQLKSLKDNVTKILEDEAKNITSLDFSDLGIDYLIVDESHMYKNLRYSTKLENVKGLGTQSGSDRAMDMFSKTTYLHNQENAKITFLTGTPVSNSLVELYLVKRYLAPKTLKEQGINSFDAWAKTYADIDKVYETGAVSGDYKVVTRFTGFKNLNTLGGSYLDFADVITNDDIKQELGSSYVPNVNIKHTKSPASSLQKSYIGIEQDNGTFNEGSIIYRLENMPDDPRIDNHLKVTNDAKYCALDYRLIDPSAPDDPNSKINKAVENILQTYKKWDDDKGTQLVFLDMGTPKTSAQKSQNIIIDQAEPTSTAIKQDDEFININETIEQGKDDNSDFITEADRDSGENRFFLYGDLLKKLVANGIPQKEIAFIHDTTTDKQKYELFDKVNRGEVRILIGSTGKMGAGTNVQERVTAIHHLDIPWKPSDLTQRNGRVIRQGNELLKKYGNKFEVDVNYYVTLNTYDETSLQTVKQKAESITKFRKCVVDENHLSGFEEEVVNYEEMKAIASGNPLILVNFKISNEIEKLERDKKAYTQDLQQKEVEYHNLEKRISYLNKRVDVLEKTKEYVAKFKCEDGLKCSMYSTNLFDGGVSKQDYFIPKANTTKEVQNAQATMKEQFQSNVNLMFETPRKSYDFCEYKGFIVSGYYDNKNNTVSFELTNKQNSEVLAPENMFYRAALNATKHSLKEQVGMSGFFLKLNNYFENLDKMIDKSQSEIKISKEKIDDLGVSIKEQPKYPNNKLLELLKDEKKIVLNELDMKKKNKAYESNFESKALKIIEENKRIKKQEIKQENYDKNVDAKIDKEFY